MNRRAIALSFMSAVLVATGLVARDQTLSTAQIFAKSPLPGTPSIEKNVTAISTSWFCAGTSALGQSANGEYGGELVISNPDSVPVEGLVTILSVDQLPQLIRVTVDPRAQKIVDIDQRISTRYASTYVELNSPSASVEQRSLHPAGVAVAPCTHQTSNVWYFADGFTAAGSDYQILMSNPFLSAAIVDIRVTTKNGMRSPANLQGFVIPAQSLRSLNIANSGFRDEEVLAVSIRATSGRFVAAKEQHFLGSGRLGHVLALGTPSLSAQWFFADGEKGASIYERFMLFNPTDQDTQADFVILGLGPTGALIDPITLTIPAHEVIEFDTAGIPGLPEGIHGALVTARADAGLAVERVLTRPAGKSVATSVVFGVQRGYVSKRWSIPTSTSIAIEDAIIVLNTSGNAGTVTIFSVGPGGEEPVPGLSDLPIEANALLSIDLVDELAFGRSLEVVSDQPIVVERRLERTPTLRGRSGSLALPE